MIVHKWEMIWIWCDASIEANDYESATLWKKAKVIILEIKGIKHSMMHASKKEQCNEKRMCILESSIGELCNWMYRDYMP